MYYQQVILFHYLFFSKILLAYYPNVLYFVIYKFSTIIFPGTYLFCILLILIITF